MKTSCNIIRDLLPLYHDDVCSEDSRQLIDEHLLTCDDCRSELMKLNMDISAPEQLSRTNIDEARPIRNIAMKWKRDRKVAFLSGTAFISLLGMIISVVSYNAIGVHVAPDGTLVEAFGFIPLGFLFAFIAAVSILSLGIIFLANKLKRSK